MQTLYHTTFSYSSYLPSCLFRRMYSEMWQQSTIIAIPSPLPSDLSAVNAICQRISRDISAAINNAKPDTINATADNKLSSSVACIFSMAKRVIASVAKKAPGNKTVNAKMKILHALLVAVAKAVGMRIKQECEYPWLDALVQFYERRCLFLFRFLLFVFFFSRAH